MPVSYTHLDVYKRQVYRSGKYKLSFSMEMNRYLNAHQQDFMPVSYTHLDVYKRQGHSCFLLPSRQIPACFEAPVLFGTCRCTAHTLSLIHI